jgi:nucleotide-binding universal stress UspA family protein
MTCLLIAYDASDAARAAVAAASALFPRADAAVACVATRVPAIADEALIRAGMPEGLPPDELEALHAQADEQASAAALEGTELAASAGLPAEIVTLPDTTPWRGLLAEARRRESDLIVCGTRGEGPVDRLLLGSTASSLLHHADRPLLIVPAGTAPSPDGPLLAGYDCSTGAEGALRFAAKHFAGRRLVVAHAWRSPVRHRARGRALLRIPVAALHDYATGMDEIFAGLAAAIADEGVCRARELGLEAEGRAPESRRIWRALLDAARDAGAAALLVGARGRGAATAAVLGSVTSALVHAAEQPVLVVPRVAEFLDEATPGR